MRTVSQAVEEVLARSPFLSEALAEGVANNAEVARRIKPDVEKYLYEEVSQSAISMALHRLGKQRTRLNFGARFLKKMNGMTVRSNLVEFSFLTSSDALEKLGTLSKAAHKKRDAFFDLSRGARETLLIVSSELADEAAALLKHAPELRRTENLSAITMHLPEESLRVPGVYYPILKALAMEGLSFVEVMSARTELSIIFEEAQVERAFSVLKKITS